MCNCGRQKYDRHHICKHLVQAVGNPSISFWQEIYRRRTAPLYRHPELVKANEDSEDEVAFVLNAGRKKKLLYNAPDGSISDGDDHVWVGDREII
ncbi:hypothetical protein CPC08DRAFT_641377, partial [Agrocybe pediades]